MYHPHLITNKLERGFREGFIGALVKLAQEANIGLDEDDAFGTPPSLLPVDNMQTYLKVMHAIDQDPKLSPLERNQLRAKLDQRDPLPEPGKSTTGLLLGAGLGAGTAKVLSDFLLSNKTAKQSLNPTLRSLLGLGAIGLGGLLGGILGGRGLSTQAHVRDPRVNSENEEYSPWKTHLI